MVIHCYILNTYWYNNVFSQSASSGPIEPPKFNQGLKSFNKDISRTVGQILKIQPHSRLQIQFSITFILCKFNIFLLFRVLNYKKKHFWTILCPPPGQFQIQTMLLSLTFKALKILIWITYVLMCIHRYKLMFQIFSFCPNSKI